MRRLRPLALGLACCAPLWADAQQADITVMSSDGHAYTMTCNAHGIVLTSRAPVGRFIGQGAGTETVSRIEKIYLGKDCDAYLDVAGEGSWGWANGGFGAEFDRYRVMFPRQGVDCPDGESDAFVSACGW